jgi:hypothetical protein
MKKTHCPSAYLSRAVLEIDQNSAQQLPPKNKGKAAIGVARHYTL